jgi:carbonic anhydrase/acetyltransferase-like protein (isoleucine patch superfamily)
LIVTFQNKTPKIAKRVFIAPSADLIGDLEIGEDSSVWFGAVIRADVNFARIGRRVSVQDGTVIHVTHAGENNAGFPTIVGDNVTIGHRVVLHGCEIANACLIGMGAIILDGAKIGAESIVGAGALVTQGKVFPPRSLILGSPAKVVRSLNDSEVAELYASADRYVSFKNLY